MTSFEIMEGIPRLEKPPQRIVSLVPSVTDSFFHLGWGEFLCGVTDFCAPPASALENLRRVGGTRAPQVEAIRQLKPDLVIANREENSKAVVESLLEANIPVWLTFPCRVIEAIDVLWKLQGLFPGQQALEGIRTLERTLDWTMKAAQGQSPVKVFCPIWQGESDALGRWWMAFNRETYCHDLLASCGGENVFADRYRRYPLGADLGQEDPEEAGERDRRYPRVTPQEVIEAAPELILLPSEPFAFGREHVEQIKNDLNETPAGMTGQIHLIDGRLITWHGTRMAEALAEIPPLLNRAAQLQAPGNT